MRGAANLCPLLGAEGLDGDAPVGQAGATVGPVAIDPRQLAQVPSQDDIARLGALLQNAGSDLVPQSDMKTIASVVNTSTQLPQWAQAVVRLGGGEVASHHPHKRASDEGVGHSGVGVPPRKKSRSFQKKSDLRVAAHGLDECEDDEQILSSQDTEGGDDNDQDRLRSSFTQEERVAESVDKYSAILRRLIRTVQQRIEDTVEGDNELSSVDIFAPQDVKTLVQSLKVMDKSAMITKCDPDLLLLLAPAMDQQVQTGLTVDVLGTMVLEQGDEEWQASGIDLRLIARLQSSLDVGICELVVMSTPEIDRRVLSEDSIDHCAQLLAHTIQRLILPCIDPTSSIIASGGSGRTPLDGSFLSPRAERTPTSGTTPSKLRNGARQLNVKVNKNAKKAMDRLLPVVCEFMEQLARLISVVKLPDRWILQFSSMMIKLFLLDFSSYATLLQRSATLVLRAIFSNYDVHRSLVLDEVVSVMVQLPTAKRNLRTVKLAGSTSVVQMITTLIVVLVQASATTPSAEKSESATLQDSTLLSENATMGTESGESGTDPKSDCDSLDRINAARTSAGAFVVALIKECMKKSEERDNRVVLENFLEDLLMMFGRPEWAGAEILLEVLSRSLAGILHANLTKDAKKLESQYCLTALNLVGRICASIKLHQNDVARDALDDEDTRAVYEEHEVYLSELLEHSSEAHVDDGTGGTIIDREVVLKHMVLTYLRRDARDVLLEDSRRMLVTQYVLEKAPSKIGGHIESVWMSFWETKSSATIDAASKLACPQRDLVVRASTSAAMSREFGRMFDFLIKHLMALLSRGIPVFRARVMKALSGIVDVDPMLMAESDVRNAVSQCFLDESTLVRQAAVDLVGKYVILQPLLLDRYFDKLCERLRDKGISVRKSVCKILRAYLTLPSQALGEELAMSEGELRRRSACMRHLVQRIGDASEEDVVKNFIIDTFQESWFGDEFSSLQLSGLNGFADEPTGGVSHDLAPPGWMMVENANDSTEGEIEEDSSATRGRSKHRSPEFVSPDGRTFNTAEEAWAVYRRPQVTPSSVVKSKQSKHDDTVATVCTIVEVVQGIATMDWFVALLKRLLYNDQPKTSAGKRPSRDRSDDASIARSRSEKIVACLVDSLMQLEERKVLKGVTGSDKDSQFLSCMKALSAFSEANPHLLSPHLEALMVYLKGDDKFSTSTESKIQSLVVNMVSNEIAHSGRVTDRIATRLESDLQDLILRAPPSVVGPSIKCLATMATHTKRPPTLLLKLLGWFFSFLEKYRQEQSLANKEPDTIGKLQRALFTVGQIGGALDFDNANFDLPVRTDPPFDKLAKGSTMDTLYDVFSAFLKIPGNPACTAKAVQGLGFLFMVRPRLLMQAQQEGVLDALLTSPSHEVRLQALSCLKELLQHEENRLEKGVERKKTLSKSKSKKGQVEGDQDGEGSLVGSVMQVQLTNLLNLTVEKNVRIRSEAVSCVAVLLTQGLISPLLCIPTLVALEADHVVSIRDIAHSQLLALHEKLPTQIHQPAVKGVFISHTFQVNAFGTSTVYALDKEKNEYSLFGRLYTACLRPVRSQRNMFLRALTNQFSDNGTVLTSNNLVTKPLKTVEYLSFLAQFVTSLPFDVEDEPLFIIYHINRNVTLTLGPTIQALKKAFTSLGVAAVDVMQDDTDVAGADISPLLKLDHEDERLREVLAQCCVGFAIQLMLRIKFHLKDVYGLDNEKCQTYQPGGATKATDQSLTRSQHSPSRLELPTIQDLQAEHPLQLSWNMFVHTCQAAQEDQNQLDFDVHEDKGRVKKKKPVRRRKSVNKAAHVDEDEEEYVEGFDG